MNLKILFRIAAIPVLLAGCGAPKVLTSFKNDAATASASGNFDQAVILWQRFFQKQTSEKKEILPEEYAQAGKAAFGASQPDQAIQWFDQARFGNYSDPEMYSALASIYRNKNNLSKELTALEYLDSSYPGMKDSSSVRNRLFKIYIEAEDPEKALKIWNKLPAASRREESFLDDYFLINSKKGENTVCDSLANLILQVNPRNLNGLEWNAKKYYWLAENRYNQEMEKYNSNKTTRQYQILLKELEKVTADFKKSLTWFEVLWKIGPAEKYASYFATIYARFGNKEKAEYYQSFMKKK